MESVTPFTTSRLLRAPRDLVYRVNTDIVHLMRWMSPAGSTVLKAEQDFRAGGRYHYGLAGPDGSETWGLQRYLEIVPNERIVLLQSFCDREGGLTRHPLAATWPLELYATTTFEEAAGGLTLVTITWQSHNSDEAGNATFDAAREGMEHGFGGTFAQLEAYLELLTNATTSKQGE